MDPQGLRIRHRSTGHPSTSRSIRRNHRPGQISTPGRASSPSRAQTGAAESVLSEINAVLAQARAAEAERIVHQLLFVEALCNYHLGHLDECVAVCDELTGSLSDDPVDRGWLSSCSSMRALARIVVGRAVRRHGGADRGGPAPARRAATWPGLHLGGERAGRWLPRGADVRARAAPVRPDRRRHLREAVPRLGVLPRAERATRAHLLGSGTGSHRGPRRRGALPSGHGARGAGVAARTERRRQTVDDVAGSTRRTLQRVPRPVRGSHRAAGAGGRAALSPRSRGRARRAARLGAGLRLARPRGRTRAC